MDLFRRASTAKLRAVKRTLRRSHRRGSVATAAPIQSILQGQSSAGDLVTRDSVEEGGPEQAYRELVVGQHQRTHVGDLDVAQADAVERRLGGEGRSVGGRYRPIEL